MCETTDDHNHDFDAARRAVLLALPAALALAGEADAQDAVKAQPTSYHVVLENEHVRVLDYTSHPGMGICGDGVHSHPAHLTVCLSPATAHVKENGHDMTVTNKLGDTFWSEAVTHEVENIGGRNVRALIIEMKPVHA